MNAKKRMNGRVSALVLSVLALQACSDGKDSVSTVSVAQASAMALEPAATVGTVVSPSIVLVDQRNRPVAGTRVTFEVTGGGGAVAESSVVTDANGRAVGTWTLGTRAGTNTLAARPSSGAAVSFSVTGEADAPHAMTAVAPVPGVAAAGAAVGTVPAVRVTDRHGNAVAGVNVEFAVTQGGGSVAATAQRTDFDGVASAGGWIAGEVPGENVLVAVSAGLPAVSFATRAVAVTDDWLEIATFGGNETTCPVDTSGCRFTVQVKNLSGAPVAGEAIIWRGPGGEVSTTTTNSRGLSTSPNLGTRNAAGTFTQTAQLLGSGKEVQFGYRLVNGGGFRIDLRYVTDVSPAVVTAFENARSRWQQVITGNLPEFALTGANAVQANACGITHPAVNEVVDDLLILIEIVPIDGPGKVLGSAGPCMIRGGSNLPILGVIKLDSDDLAAMDANGTLRDVILHEMGHVLGLGTLWRRSSLVEGAGSSDPFYTGARALPGFVLGGGTLINGVPVENTGSAGIRDSHWRETRLGNELMTGFINSAGNPLSGITIGALMDLGYQVNFGAADGYALPGTMGAQSLRAAAQELIEVPLPEPLRVF